MTEYYGSASAPQFESPEDTANQLAVMNEVARIFNIKATPTPPCAAMDFYFERSNQPNILHPAEIRCRTNSIWKYPTFFINHSKWLIGKAEAEKRGSHFFIFIRFKDGLFFTDETDKTDTGTRFVAEGGRTATHRGVESDRSQVIHIPNKELIKIKGAFK
jgi:hypothetical protein